MFDPVDPGQLSDVLEPVESQLTIPRPTPDIALVVPTVGRASLAVLLAGLADLGRNLAEVILVDDRPGPTGPPALVSDGPPRVRVIATGGRGPAAARNAGWQATTCEWIVFLDDDVVPGPRWCEELRADLVAAEPDVIAVQGTVQVPRPDGRAATDWERQTIGLETARWITADIAYRRAVLAGVGGFDESFPRAFREDADLGLRATRSGRATVGGRTVLHPARPAPWWISVARQRGNADDIRMARKHGSRWRRDAGASRGRRNRHGVIVAAAVTAVAATAARRPRLGLAAAAVWLAGTVEFAASRIAPGPRTTAEIATMLATSVAIPPAAVTATLRGLLAPRPEEPRLPDAVFFDRDGTLVHDVPYNADPERVRAVPGARAALDALRHAGIPVGLVTNQSAVGLGLATRFEVAACNRELARQVGEFATVQICPHTPDQRCGCRKPAGTLVRRAAGELGVDPSRCVVVGDIGTDVDEARAAGAHAILVPDDATTAADRDRSPRVAPSIGEATRMILAGVW